MRRQYLQIKHRFPDTILLFRLGDFYETFDDDAHIAAATLDIALTSREMGKGLRVPMAGIPHHAAETHIGRLVAAGHKVAICDQIGEPQKGRALVERDVTRVVTPGTVTDPALLDARRNTFITAAIVDGSRAGLAHADVSTGEFATTEFTAASSEETLLALGRELLRLAPAEIVLAGVRATDPEHGADYPPWLPADISRSIIEPYRCRIDRAAETLTSHFGVDSLDGFGCAGKPFAIRAAGALLAYLADTQRSQLGQIAALRTYATDRFMTLDAQTRRNLELTESGRGERRHSLIAVLDRTETPMGARLLRRWIGQPLLDLGELEARQEGVARFVAAPLARAALRRALSAIGDVERLVNRAVTGVATPRDLVTLRQSLAAVPGAAEAADGAPAAATLSSLLDVVSDAHTLLERALPDDPPSALGKGDAIRPGFAAELDGHQARAREAREWIAGLERSERERTGIRSLKVGYNRVFGYYLEVTAVALAAAEREREDGAALPDDYLPKQTLVNATRYFTPTLKEYETIVLTAEETLAAIEADVFRRVTTQIAGAARSLLAAAAVLAELDVLAALAEVAATCNYVRPTLDESGVIAISDGRHPTLEALLGPGEFVPNDADLATDDAQITILTGPNMAGKSSWLRQTALIVLLAQIGSFVPAREARIGLVDRIFTRIGAQDDIASGQSTFMVEMLETANILHHATRRSLVVLDEIGRGTSTYDGLAIARAIVEHLHNAPRLGCRTLFATHYHELTELEALLPRVCCRTMDVLEDGDRVVFLRRVVPGAADRSYGLHVAQLAGIPRSIVRRAQDLLVDLETARRDGPPNVTGRSSRPRTPDAEPALQLTLFSPPDPVLEVLKALDIEALSPLEAITKLFELQQMTRGAT
ncbi:MAG: DNA mismatch repair protein MutS [Thermomicrobiales bacterium]|nr:DNA mismatch repair protein MutS [Thermomicrobiales bacterium]